MVENKSRDQRTAGQSPNHKAYAGRYERLPTRCSRPFQPENPMATGVTKNDTQNLLIRRWTSKICSEVLLAQAPSDKATAIRYFEEIANEQKLDLLDQIFADSFIVHMLNDNTVERKSIADQREFLEYLFNAFPDIHYTIGEIIQEDDKIAMSISLEATHKNEFWGYEASGKKIEYLSEIFFFRFKDGKIIETWVQLDLHYLNEQLKGDN